MADEPKRPQNPNIPIQASARTQRGFYSNLARVTHSPEEFVLDFLFLHHDPPFGRLGARVLLSPAHMKRLAAALQENVTRYETRFGVIQEHPGPEMPGGMN